MFRVRFGVRFLVIVLLPSTLLVVSGWRLMRQEESLVIQEGQARRDQMADDLIAMVRQRLEPIVIPCCLRQPLGLRPDS